MVLHTHTHRWWEGGNWTSSGFTCLGASRSQPTGPEPRARNRLGCENPRKTSCPPCETFCGGPSRGGRWGGLRRPFQAVAWKIVSCTRRKFARMGTYHKGKGIRQVVGAKVTWRVFFFFFRAGQSGGTDKWVRNLFSLYSLGAIAAEVHLLTRIVIMHHMTTRNQLYDNRLLLLLLYTFVRTNRSRVGNPPRGLMIDLSLYICVYIIYV